MLCYSPLEVAYFESLSSDPTTGVIEGRFYWNSAQKKITVYDGTQWRAAAGGGGGGGAAWNPPSGSAPLEAEENGEKVWLFESGLSNKLVLFAKVPESYAPGTQIKANIGLYSPSAANTILLETTTYLIRDNTDAVTSTTNSHASTNPALTNASANRYRNTEVDLSDASGEVNSVAVSAGDLLRVELARGTDTDTADIRFIPGSTELIFT